MKSRLQSVQEAQIVSTNVAQCGEFREKIRYTDGSGEDVQPSQLRESRDTTSRTIIDPKHGVVER